MQEKLNKFAALIEKHKRARYAKQYPDMPESIVDADSKVRIKPGRKYVKVDVGHSGVYMVDMDGNIFGIKGYGVIHRGHRFGTLDTIDEWNWGGYRGVKLKKDINLCVCEYIKCQRIYD